MRYLKPLLPLICALLTTSVAFAAIPSTAVWEVRTGGATNNGGFYDAAIASAGTDYSTSNTPQVSVTDAVTNGTSTVTSATANFTSAMIGNGVCINSAWYEVQTVPGSTSITVDRTITTASGLTLKVGGAVIYPGLILGANKASAGNTIWIKAGAYALNTTGFNANNTSMDCSSTGGTTSSPYRPLWIVGYNATRGDNSSTRPVFTCSGTPSSTGAFIANSGTDVVFENLEIDCANLNIRGIYLAAGRGTAIRCKVSNCAGSAAIAIEGANSKAIDCEAVGGGSSTGFGFLLAGAGNQALYCEAHGMANDGFATNGSGTGVFLYGCLAYSVTGSNHDGFDVGTSIAGSVLMVNCSAYSNAAQGFRFVTTQPYPQHAVNCLAVSNTGAGFGALVQNERLFNCAAYGNASTYSGSDAVVEGFVTLSGDPFTAAGSADFSLNNTSGAGAACRAAGFPATFLRGTTANYIDIGAAQASVPATPAVTRSYGAVH